MEDKTRLDIAVKKKYEISRDYAKELIKKGAAEVNGRVIKKPGELVSDNDEIMLDESMLMPYVGRGGLKLEEAVKKFHIELKGKICIDTGASTGGFTDCMLQNGAERVFAVDVGNNQLAEKLRNDERVISMENTDIRTLTAEDFGGGVDFASIDVSFISLKKVLEYVKAAVKDGGEIVALIKPQFEAGRENIGKNGIVKNMKIHKRVIKEIAEYAQETGLDVIDTARSPITGAKGNVEYLIYLRKQ